MYPMYALAFNPTITTYVAEMSIIKYRKLILELHSKLTSHPKWAFEVAEKFYLKLEDLLNWLYVYVDIFC